MCLKVFLVLLDRPWSDALSLTIEVLADAGDSKRGQAKAIPYPPEADFKVKVAVLEAATRISFSRKVAICTQDEQALAFQKYVTYANL